MAGFSESRKETGMANPNPNPETRFKDGESGNPAGRPRRKPITDAILEELALATGRAKRTKAQHAARKLVQLMLQGDTRAAKLVMAYVEGLPRQPVDVTIRQEAERIAGATGADPDWLLRRAEEIAGESIGA